jgi:shikimate 5-dehydrogenase
MSSPMLMTVVATPLSHSQAVRLVEHIFVHSGVVGDAASEDVRVEAAQELVNLSNAMNWRGLVAGGIPIPLLLTILKTLLPQIIKNATVLDFLMKLFDLVLPFIPV